MFQCTISKLEQESGWTKNVGPTINPIAPTAYEFVQEPDGLRMYCIGPAYAGWLLKHVDPFPVAFTKLVFRHTLNIDDATLQDGQVSETDWKATDADGWTRDGSFQINFAKGRMTQVNNPWTDTGVAIPSPDLVPGQPLSIEKHWTLNYVTPGATLDALIVNGTPYPIGITIPAQKLGWAPNQLVTQLQQCIAGQPGAYSLKFSDIGYDLS